MAQESGGADFSAGSNGTHEHHREPAAPRESFAPPESREPREFREQPEPREPREAREQRESREAPTRHEEPAAPLAHFEPAPPTESHAARETKPYVVWSSAPSEKAASGGSRGPEE